MSVRMSITLHFYIRVATFFLLSIYLMYTAKQEKLINIFPFIIFPDYEHIYTKKGFS